MKRITSARSRCISRNVIGLQRCLNKMLSEKQMHRGDYRSYANAVTTAFL